MRWLNILPNERTTALSYNCLSDPIISLMAVSKLFEHPVYYDTLKK